MYALKYSTDISSMLFSNLLSEENSTHHLFWQAQKSKKVFLLCSVNEENFVMKCKALLFLFTLQTYQA